MCRYTIHLCNSLYVQMKKEKVSAAGLLVTWLAKTSAALIGEAWMKEHGLGNLQLLGN